MKTIHVLLLSLTAGFGIAAAGYAQSGLGAGLGAGAEHDANTALAANEAKADFEIHYPKTVVELFTSQGCSSCPPANTFVRNMADQNEADILALSYSVDYWDYLGWKDTLGNPAFSARQREYGQRFQGQVYTPQIVLNGSRHSAMFGAEDIVPPMRAQYRPPIKAEPSSDGASIKAQLTLLPASVPRFTSITYKTGEQTIDVKGGENRGRAIKLVNAVTKVTPLKLDTSEGGYSAIVPMPAKGYGVAVIVQAAKGGPVFAATHISR